MDALLLDAEWKEWEKVSGDTAAASESTLRQPTTAKNKHGGTMFTQVEVVDCEKLRDACAELWTRHQGALVSTFLDRVGSESSANRFSIHRKLTPTLPLLRSASIAY